MPVYNAVILMCDQCGCSNLFAELPSTDMESPPMYKPDPKEMEWELTWDPVSKNHHILCRRCARQGKPVVLGGQA